MVLRRAILLAILGSFCGLWACSGSDAAGWDGGVDGGASTDATTDGSAVEGTDTGSVSDGDTAEGTNTGSGSGGDSGGADETDATDTGAGTGTAIECEDADGDGWCAEIDCDDSDSAIHQEAEEVAGNGVDDDCDGETDEASVDTETGSDTFNECAEVSQAATMELLPADIIIVVDNSGSMTDETEMVQANLNGFSSQIIASGVDAHVVVVSGYEDEFNNGICVESPLGSGNCPEDSNLPAYLHIDRYITSHYAPKWVTDEYELWRDMLRTNARTHFLFVSDDNPYQTAEDFDKLLTELDPPITDYTVHAIAAAEEKEEACDREPPGPCCEYAVNEGVDYKDMATRTGGVFGDLCLQEFQPVFDELAQVVSALALECEWAIPKPPVGATLDPGKVNLDIRDDQAQTHAVGNVATKNDCAGVLNGWYYDDPSSPTQMLLCEQTCQWVRGLPSAEILVKFGCETQVAQPT